LGTLAGLECDHPVGRGNGVYQGNRYFMAKEKHAAFVPLTNLKRAENINAINDFYQNGYDRANVEVMGDRRFLGPIGAPVPPRPHYPPHLYPVQHMQQRAPQVQVIQNPQNQVPQVHITQNPQNQVPQVHITQNPQNQVPQVHITQNPQNQVPQVHITQNPQNQVPKAHINQNPQNQVPQVHIIQNPPPNDQLLPQVPVNQPVAPMLQGQPQNDADAEHLFNSNGHEEEAVEEVAAEEEEEEDEEEYFESDDDMDDKLNVDFSEMERRLKVLVLKKNPPLVHDVEIEAESARSTDSASPAAVVLELDAAGVPIKESSDQWSKVAEKLKKAPSQVQEKLATEKAPLIVSKKKEKAPVYIEELAKNNPKYKKTLCHFWVTQGNCMHKERCLFAHGEKELVPEVKPKYHTKKSILCQYHVKGGCRNGDHCGFAHGEHELNTYRK